MKRNPRPRKYESAAARQAAYKARAEMLEFRAEPKTAATLTSIAQELDVSRSELLLSMVKFALTNHDWARFGLTHKTLPYYQGNPIMATKKASPAQLAARKKFAEMARSGAFKKAKKNPAKKGLYSNIDAKRKRIAAGSGEKMRKPGSPGAPTNANFKAAAKTAKRNPMGEKFVVGKYYETRFIGDQNIKVGATILSRTDKTVKVKGTDNMMKSSYRLSMDMNQNECFYPYGKYSMSPMLCADDMKPQSNPIGEMREFTVMKWKRGKNTTNGNPVYEFILKDEFGGMHTGKTKPNAGWVYGISSVYEGDKINAALEETKGGRVYMVDYGKRKSNPVKRSSRSAVVPNPAAKKPQKVYRVSIMQDGLHKNWMGIANFFTFAEAENYSRYLSKQHPNWAIRVHDTRAMK